MKIYKDILFIIFYLTAVSAGAQNIERFNTFGYNVNEGLLQSTIHDIACDKNNFLWISFPNGLQKFDGKNFTHVPVQPGLPDNKFIYLFNCKEGTLLLSHKHGISKYKITNNSFEEIYRNEQGQLRPSVFIGEDENSIYFFTQNGTITGIDATTFKVQSSTKINIPAFSSNNENTPKISSNIINHRFAFFISFKFYLFDLKDKSLLAETNEVRATYTSILRLKNENQVFYSSEQNPDGFELYDFNTKILEKHIVSGNTVKNFSRCLIYPWYDKILITFSEKVYETDTLFSELKSEIVNFQNKPISGNLNITQIKEDNFGNLYIQTVTGGIKKIIRNNYPIKYYGTDKKENNNIISILPDKINNRILAGTIGNGLYIFDTLQRLVKHIQKLPNSNTPVSINTIVKTPSDDYLLFFTGKKYACLLKKNLTDFQDIPFHPATNQQITGSNFFGNFLFKNEKYAVIQTQGKLYRIAFPSNYITEYEVTKSYTMGGLLYHNMIVTHFNDELIFLDATTLKQIKKTAFENTGNVRCIAKDADDNIYLGCNTGIFKIDSNGNQLRHITRENGITDECIYAMLFDEDGSLWCSTNRGIFRLNKDNSILQLTKEDGLQENEFNTNIAARAEDGEIFFGGVNGVSSFYPKKINSFEEEINLLITKIKINNEEAFKDTAVWNITHIDLPFDKNSLSFDFIAMANNNPGQYIYQYKMEGIDNEWIQNEDLQTVRYFLPPGKYVFMIYASRFFDKNAKPMKQISITIKPQFWKTWWFITAGILLVLSVLAYTFNRFNKTKYEKRLIALESERKLQSERERISRDLHDNIGAYANAVLYNTELLQKEVDATEKIALMKDLKFASKDIITSLRETVWALKKDNFTAEDCLLRIKNFMQALARYYPDIYFKVEGEAPQNEVLHHTKALNIVRILQEAVTNAIKHAKPQNIILSNRYTDGKWQLRVIDDGKGFDYKAAKFADSGNGLLNMKQRAKESDAEFSIISQINGGTQINIFIGL